MNQLFIIPFSLVAHELISHLILLKIEVEYSFIVCVTHPVS